MLTPNDAMGLAEDLAIINAHRRSIASKSEMDVHQRSQYAIKLLGEKLDEAGATIERLAGEIKKGNDCNAQWVEHGKKMDAALAKAKEDLRLMQERAIKAETELMDMRDRNAASVASSNAAALALKDAVADLEKVASSSTAPSVQPPEYYLRTVRTRHFNKQVNELMARGQLKVDPRTSPEMKARVWYEENPDAGVSGLGT